MAHEHQTLKLACLLAALLFASVEGKGWPTYEGEFPYAVSIRVKNVHVCGGAIVSENHVLTAANCVKYVGDHPEVVTVKTGYSRLLGGEVHSVSKMIVHPQAGKPDSWYHDFAVLKLSAPMVFNKYQNKISLPTAGLPSGVRAVVTGWGFVAIPFGPFSLTLRKQSVNIRPNTVCQKYLSRGVPADSICAVKRFGLDGICSGDSGSPLVYNNELAGLIEGGALCVGLLPDVYSNVFAHLSFIQEAMTE